MSNIVTCHDCGSRYDISGDCTCHDGEAICVDCLAWFPDEEIRGCRCEACRDERRGDGE